METVQKQPLFRFLITFIDTEQQHTNIVADDYEEVEPYKYNFFRRTRKVGTFLDVDDIKAVGMAGEFEF